MKEFYRYLKIFITTVLLFIAGFIAWLVFKAVGAIIFFMGIGIIVYMIISDPVKH